MAHSLTVVKAFPDNWIQSVRFAPRISAEISGSLQLFEPLLPCQQHMACSAVRSSFLS